MPLPTTPARLYLDNAATSFPKPRAVTEAMTRYATDLGASPGRGAYRESREAAELMWRCRERLCTLINGEKPEHIVFTLNTSDALNLAIRGLLDGRDRPHVVTTHMDHNSVLRPFNALTDDGAIEQTRVPVDPDTGIVDPDDIRRAIRPNTKLVAAVHASNVTGSLQPIGAIGRVCRECAVPLLVDAAQTIGHLPIDVQDDCIDLLA
ncbi:MAG: aminotransferase class V-fold PLP-dependent enzyme, partial [Planctomycetota bacterium]